MQTAVYTFLFWKFLNGSREGTQGERKLPSFEEVSDWFSGELPRAFGKGLLMLVVPVNLKDRDAFHITIEEYLLALTDLSQEISRVAVTSVTMGDYELPVIIQSFLRDLFTGFQMLNLKNDILRKRIDGAKYDLKRVEDVVYDLALRNLVPKQA